MELERLKQIISAFADDPTSLIMEKGRLVFQIQGELIEATTEYRDGQLLVAEGGQPEVAAKWVAARVAQLDQLAHRISTIFQENPRFIVPRGRILDHLQEQDTPVPDAVDAASEFLSRRPAGVASVLYLTSNAGEGKTTLIAQLAHKQAKAYLSRRSNWLLVPFNLGGNTFLRLDNIIAAGLLNQLRTRRFYLDGFIHLVRLGYLVPALDGFEEVFVEGAGEAVSSLGTLIRDMRGEGTMLIAARTAYFEYKRLDSQARLFDTISNEFEFGFGKLALAPWGRDEFVKCCRLSGLAEAENVYQTLLDRLGDPNHALLTRAFFVTRIADLATADGGLAFLRNLQPKVQDYFRPFVRKILERETQKWVGKDSQVTVPLLTAQEHAELLMMLAEEMWLSKRGSLPRNTCVDLADLYCEVRKKSPIVSRQVRERLSDHALLSADSGGQLAFDHEHFREYFLGEQLGFYLRALAVADVKKLFRIDAIPGWTLDSAVSCAAPDSSSCRALLEGVSSVALSEGPASFVRENCGGLSVRLVERLNGELPVPSVANQTLPPEALAGRALRGAIFSDCYARATTASGTICSVAFKRCEFEHLQIADQFRFEDTAFEDCVFYGLTVTHGDNSVDYYDPRVIESYLSQSGATISQGGQKRLFGEAIPEDDESIKRVRKLIQFFQRANQISDEHLSLKFGVNASDFFGSECDRLLSGGVLREIKHRGGGRMRRYQLGRSLSGLSTALAGARGSFDEFLRLVGEMDYQPANERESEGE